MSIENQTRVLYVPKVSSPRSKVRFSLWGIWPKVAAITIHYSGTVHCSGVEEVKPACSKPGSGMNTRIDKECESFGQKNYLYWVACKLVLAQVLYKKTHPSELALSYTSELAFSCIRELAFSCIREVGNKYKLASTACAWPRCSCIREARP